MEEYINAIQNFITNYDIVQWATILSPIIAVLIAVCTIKKSAKETEKKLAALEKSTNKQVDKLTQLMKLQTEITSIHLGKELWETHFRLHELTGQKGNALEDNRNIRSNLNKVELEGMTEEDKAYYHKIKFYDEQLQSLEGHIRRLEKVKEELGVANPPYMYAEDNK